MQAQNPTISDFARRTDALALAKGISLSELAVEIGISRDMMMGYRTGRHEPSKKALAKLAKAEDQSGFNLEYLRNPKKFSAPLKLASEIAKAIGGTGQEQQRNFEITERILTRALLPKLEEMERQIAEFGNLE